MAHPNDLDFDFWRRTQKYDSAVGIQALPDSQEKYLPGNRRHAKPGESTTSATEATRDTKPEPESLGSGPGSRTADNEEPLELEQKNPAPAISATPRGTCSKSPAPNPGAEGAPVQSGNFHHRPSHNESAAPQLTDNEPLPLTETPQMLANGEVTECNNTGQNSGAGPASASPRKSEASTQTPVPDPGAERPHFTRDQKYVLNHVAMGGTLCTAAEDLNCTPQRFYNWKRRVKHFGPALVEARELYTKRVADGFHEAETDARMLIHDIVRDQSIQPHIRLRAALAIMRRKKNSNWLPDPIEPEPDRHSYAHIPEEPEDEPDNQGPETWPADTWPADTWPAGTNPDISTETAIAIEATRSNSTSEAMWSTSASEGMRDTKTEPESSGSGPGSPTADTAPPLKSTSHAQAEPESSGRGHTETHPANATRQPTDGASEAMRPTSRVSGLEKIAGVRSEPERAETPGTNSERSETMEHLPLAASATPSGHIVAVDRTPPITASVSACSATPREAWSETSPQSLNPNPGAQRHTCSASPLETPGVTSHRESRLSDYTVLAGESRIHFHELRAELQRSYEPKSPVEELTVLRLTQVFWVLRRLDGIETAVWDSDVEIQRTTNPRIPVVAALALSYLDINENQRTRFQQRLQKMRAVHERRVDELTDQLLRFRSQRENHERHDERREERPEWQKAQATKAKHRHHYCPEDEIPGPSLFNRDAGEHLSARINPIQQTRAF